MDRRRAMGPSLEELLDAEVSARERQARAD
jgi:hypothetical protein